MDTWIEHFTQRTFHTIFSGLGPVKHIHISVNYLKGYVSTLSSSFSLQGLYRTKENETQILSALDQTGKEKLIK